MDQASPSENPIYHGTEEEQKSFVCTLYVRGVKEILKSLQDFATQTGNTEGYTEGKSDSQAVWMPKIEETTLKKGIGFSAVLEMLLIFYRNMKGPGLLEDKLKESCVAIPHPELHKHLINRARFEEKSLPFKDSKHVYTADNLEQAQKEAQWIRGAMVLREVQAYLAGDEWAKEVQLEVKISKQDLIKALQNCVWTFLGQGKIVMPLGKLKIPVMPDTDMYHPGLYSLLTDWVDGHSLAKLMEFDDYAPVLPSSGRVNA